MQPEERLLRKSETIRTPGISGALTVTCKTANSRNTCMMKKQMKNSYRYTLEALRNPNLDRDVTEIVRRVLGFD